MQIVRPLVFPSLTGFAFPFSPVVPPIFVFLFHCRLLTNNPHFPPSPAYNILELAARPKAPKAVANAARMTSFRCEDMRASCGCAPMGGTASAAQKKAEGSEAALHDSSLLHDATLVYLMNQVCRSFLY